MLTASVYAVFRASKKTRGFLKIAVVSQTARNLNFTDPETCLKKTGSETGFLALNIDRLLDRDFQGRFSDRKVEQVLNTETGF